MPLINDASEELLGQKYVANEPRQAELVEQYCGDIEDRIHAAGSEFAARLIADDACKSFATECESAVVKHFLRKHVENLFHHHWKSKNRL